MSKRELANLADDFLGLERKEVDDEAERYFTFHANEMYNRMKGLDASASITFVPHTAAQISAEQKICDTRKNRQPCKRRIAATVNPKLPLPVPAPESQYIT